MENIRIFAQQYFLQRFLHFESHIQLIPYSFISHKLWSRCKRGWKRQHSIITYSKYPSDTFALLHFHIVMPKHNRKFNCAFNLSSVNIFIHFYCHAFMFLWFAYLCIWFLWNVNFMQLGLLFKNPYVAHKCIISCVLGNFWDFCWTILMQRFSISSRSFCWFLPISFPTRCDREADEVPGNHTAL